MNEECIALDRKSVPLYDRGYSLEGGLKVVDASRCFNCGSYNHSLKECPKPRDNVAVNNARKQHKSRRFVIQLDTTKILLGESMMV